jgi:hypothetical protein
VGDGPRDHGLTGAHVVRGRRGRRDLGEDLRPALAADVDEEPVRAVVEQLGEREVVAGVRPRQMSSSAGNRTGFGDCAPAANPNSASSSRRRSR